MEGEESEQLFLLEFLVDSVRIKNPANFADRRIDSIPSHLTTIFQFLKYPPLEIKENDQPNKGDEIPTFKMGVLPEKTILGETTVDISSDFAYVVTEVLTNPHAIPKSRATRNSYILKSPGDNSQVGAILLYLRISCFGKLIVNEFQLNCENSFLFHSEKFHQPPKQDEVRRADEPYFPPYNMGTGEEVVAQGRSSSESSARTRYTDDDYTEVGAKVQGRWVTIRVPKQKLLTHAGNFCQLGTGVGAPGGAGAVEQFAPITHLAKCYDPLGRGTFALTAGGTGGRVGSAGSGSAVGSAGGGGSGCGSKAASLPVSRESASCAGCNITPSRIHPTIAPLDLVHPNYNVAMAGDGKMPKSKGKGGKVKPNKGDRKVDSKKNKKRL